MFEILLWSIGAPTGYLTVAGFTRQKVYEHLRATSSMSKDGDLTAAFFSGVFWPAVGPLAVGSAIARKQFALPTLSDYRQRKQVAKANFMVEVAKARLEEAKYLKAAEEANPLSLSRFGENQ